MENEVSVTAAQRALAMAIEHTDLVKTLKAQRDEIDAALEALGQVSIAKKRGRPIGARTRKAKTQEAQL